MGAIDDCQNLEESYGEICVHCNKCGRFDSDKPKNELSHEDDNPLQG